MRVGPGGVHRTDAGSGRSGRTEDEPRAVLPEEEMRVLSPPSGAGEPHGCENAPAAPPTTASAAPGPRPALGAFGFPGFRLTVCAAANVLGRFSSEVVLVSL